MKIGPNQALSVARAYVSLRCLVRFPVFWLGLLFLGYLLIQGFNPAWQLVEVQHFRWIEPISHLQWLPTGMDTPFTETNPFRVLLTTSSALMLLWTVWVGIQNRSRLLFLLCIATVNSALVALIALILRLKDIKLVLEIVPWAPYILGIVFLRQPRCRLFKLRPSLGSGTLFSLPTPNATETKQVGPAPAVSRPSAPHNHSALFSLSRTGISAEHLHS